MAYRRLLIAALLVAGVAGAIVIATPLIITPAVVKERIADQITRWTGRAVAFKGEPKISVFPYLTVRIDDVTLANPDGMTGKPFIAMEALVARIELLPLLIGRTEVAEFRMMAPEVNLTVQKDGKANWVLSEGAVGTQAEKSDRDDAAIPSGEPDYSDIALGRFVMKNGTIRYHDERSGRRDSLAAVNADFGWPSTSAAASGSGSFDWRGGTVEFRSTVEAPMALLAGGASALRLALTSTALRASFDGTAITTDGLQADGEATVTTPSVRSVVAWLGTPMGEGSILGAGSISGHVSWIAPTLSFSDATIELDGNTAEGALSASFAETRPEIQGTLALEQLDLSAYFEALRAAFVAAEGPIALPLRLADLDLRLSSSEVVIGEMQIGRAAAAASVKDGRLTLDIGEAQIYDGHAEADIGLEMKGGVLSATAHARFDSIPAGTALIAAAGSGALQGTGSGTVNVAADGRSWAEIMRTLSGTAKVEIANATLAGLDIGRLAALRKDPQAMSEPSGSTAFTTIALTLGFAGGRLTTANLRAAGDGFGIDLDGSVGVFDGAVAAKGTLTTVRPVGVDPAAPSDVPFAIVGNWFKPVVLPDAARLVKRNETRAVTPELVRGPPG